MVAGNINSTAKLKYINKTVWVSAVAALLSLAGCATYYQQNIKFFQAFEAGNLTEAGNILEQNKKGPSHKNRLLYWLNLGTVHALTGEYGKSNTEFETAYKLCEDYLTNYVNEGLGFLINPGVTEYRGEDHEVLLIHYYQALNYLKLGQPAEALVECKRMDDLLNRLGDKYKGANKYKRDAFIHNLMGLVYDVNHDANNAFIAYRNAFNIYQDDYTRLFGVGTPEQLKADLIRTAYQSGFTDEAGRYEKQFNLKYRPKPAGTGELVFIWHNGLGPIKAEWGINFTIIRGSGGYVTFHNEEMGLNFPFFLGEDDAGKNKAQGLSRLEFIRVAFPKYVERKTVYSSASLKWNGTDYPLEKATDINAIAFKTLDERMLLEMGKALLRVALKKLEEEELRKKDQGAGAALGFLNALTEKADTRNWETLPHDICYARIPLPPGEQNVHFAATAKQGFQNTAQDFTFCLKAGETFFHTQNSLDYQRGNIPY